MDYMEGMGAVMGGDEYAHVPYDSQILPVYAAMLHTGKLTYFSGSGNNNRNFPRKRMAARLRGPATGQIEAVPVHLEQRDLSSAGHCFLPDGKLLVSSRVSSTALASTVMYFLCFWVAARPPFPFSYSVFFIHFHFRFEPSFEVYSMKRAAPALAVLPELLGNRAKAHKSGANTTHKAGCLVQAERGRI